MIEFDTTDTMPSSEPVPSRLDLRDVLATLPDGDIGHPLSDSELTIYLNAYCNRAEDIAREKSHALRDALFHDGGLEEMKSQVGQVFRATEVIERVTRMLPLARFSNPTKRIVSEIATVYAEPAARSVGGGDGNAEKYDNLCESMALDEQMDTICTSFNLHRAVVVCPRVQLDGTLVLDVVSAATARPVMHPNDNTLIVGWLTRCQLRSVRGAYSKPAAWLLTTSLSWEYFDDDFTPIAGTRKEHGFTDAKGRPVCPWVPVCDAMYAADFWPGDDGEGLTAAHLTGWLVEALMVKEVKTATHQPVIQGDVTTMARGQPVESDTIMQAPEGTMITSVEFGTDTTIFMGVADHALERAGNDVGLSLATLKHQGAQSADAREIILAPVRERRRRQVKKFRRFERQLAEVIAIVTKKHAPEIAFELVEWRIDFGEPQVLLSKKERLEIFGTEKTLGLDSTFKFFERENPDITREQAIADVLENLDDETKRIIAMRLMQSLSGGTSTAPEDAPPPNGTKVPPQFSKPSAATDGKGSSAPMDGTDSDAGSTGEN